MSAATRIHALVMAKLAGRKIDVVGFVDDLLQLSKEVGEIHCSLATEDRLRFAIPDQDSCEVALDAGRGKLRMLCARLCVLCNASGASTVSSYGGEGAIKVPASNLPENGKPLTDRFDQWTTRFKNTPAQQEFTLAAVKDRSAHALST